MKTDYVILSLPLRYSRDRGDPRAAGPLARALTAAGPPGLLQGQRPAGQRTQSGLSVDARAAARERVAAQFEEARIKFNAENQPRDTAGKFRKVLARLKMNLGDQASEELAKEMEAAAAAGAIGNYGKARTSAANVIGLIQDVEEGHLAKGTLNNIREGSRQLGKLLAYLPLPQGSATDKVRFSDLPKPTADLILDLLKRVNERLSNEDAIKYTQVLNDFRQGVLTMGADDMSVELSRLMRVLA